jgi:Ca-activated chloride channel family protein
MRIALHVAVALAFPFISAVQGAPAPPARPISPTRVLAGLTASGDATSRMMYMPGGPGDATDAGGDRTLAPFLYVAGGDPDTERLPLRETSAEVEIAGVIARVAVRQLFENGGPKPIEAVYVFPASTRAAVHGMRMKIGARVIEAHIDRRQAAREDYEAARSQGRRASLLEQERPNVFTMSVANVMPGDRIEVHLDYSELLVPDQGVYEFMYPAVVGPRYTGGADPAKDQWMANPHLPAGQPAPYGFDVGVHLETGMPLKAVSSPSHAIDVRYASSSSADVKLRDKAGGDRDYVLRYRLADDKIETGLLLGPRQADGDGFFALMMEPPQRPAPAQIPPREYLFLLDVSGSMHGFPLDTAKALMRKLLGQLRPTDQFNLALFSGANFVMSPSGSVPATRDQIASALELVERQQGGGGTELMGGLEAVYRIPRRDQAVSRTVVVVTDGYVGVEAQAFRFIRERLDKANLFAFGIGTSVNRALIEGMARAGLGEPFVVLCPERAAAEAEKLRAYIEQPVLTRVAVRFDHFAVAEVSPAKVPDLMARRPLVVFGKYHGEPEGHITVTGIGGGGAPFSRTVEVRRGSETPKNQALRWLWARSWVATLEDERHMGAGKEVEEAITDLGLRHSLLTAFTSFVAADREIVNPGGQAATVRQPLPMPAGVPNSAVGAARHYAAKSKASVNDDNPLEGLSSSSRSGAGGRSYASTPPPPSASPPRTTTAAEGDAMEEAEAKAEAPSRRAQREPSPALLLVTASAAGLGDTASLAAAFATRLAAVRAGCPRRAGQVTLRLTVDAAGRVVAVDAVSGDAAVAAYLRAKLLGLSSATRPTAKTGTWMVTLRVSAGGG